MDASYILTRFLYIKDEVELSFITALLKKRNIQECYYWAFELYYSGFAIVPLLWQIYLDFYYEMNPVMEDYMIKKLSTVDDKDDKEKKKDGQIAIMSVIRNLYRLKSSPSTFILRQYIQGDILPSVIYKQAHAHAQATKFYKLVQSLESGITGDICYYIKELLNDTDIEAIKTVILDFVNPSIARPDYVEYNAFALHYLLAIICRLQTPISSLNKCNIFVKPKDVDIEFVTKVENEPIPLIQTRGFVLEQTYNTLGFKRYFKIDETIGSFQLARWTSCGNLNYPDFLNMNWFHWEYYAANGCPLWRERLEKCHGALDHIKQIIIFPRDDINDSDSDSDKEQFYNLYAYEFDEQPKEIQRMSHCELKKNTWKEWYFDIFPEQPMTIVELKDDLTFLRYNTAKN